VKAASRDRGRGAITTAEDYAMTLTVRWPALLIGVLVAAPAAAGETASFITGTYAMEGRCAAWAAIEAGGPRNVETVPETLTADGFSSWEGGCSFVSVKEVEESRRWVATMECGEEVEEWTEEDTFNLDPASGRISVTVEGKTSVYERCDVAKGN
jgi:hypothetical protein